MDASATRHPSHSFTMAAQGVPNRRSATKMWLCDHCGVGFYTQAALEPCHASQAERVMEIVRNSGQTVEEPRG